MVDIPDLLGCRVWAESANAVLAELSVVAEQFIISNKDRGDQMPAAIVRSLDGQGRISVAVSLTENLTRKLRRLGCAFDRQAGGSHEIWIDLSNNRRAIIPRHGSRDLATGMVRRYPKGLGHQQTGI